jgi:superfamily I DNA/RNA helicase
MGTSDPADVAKIAYEFLLNNPEALHGIRSRLHHVVLDEYQDVSVSQHQLLQLVINGIPTNKAVNDKKYDFKSFTLPVLMDQAKMKKQQKDPISYNVPNFFAAGDSNQSIYGWRGASPILTVDGFRNDFPQGIVIPFNTSYRLPRVIFNTANMVIGQSNPKNNDYNVDETCFDISPAAAVRKNSICQEDNTSETKCVSSVVIQGLWDAREESKFIASSIRRKAKERMNQSKELHHDHDSFDSSDVAIMVRSSNEIELHIEALESMGIPFEYNSSDDVNSIKNMRGARGKRISNNIAGMKPVKIITMHQAKGDEYDDIYLAGWTEGNFPHPSSVRTNRIHEERRIAYVALTRAREKVTITYSFMAKTAYFGPKGEKKFVTEQVLPSRFLNEIKLDSMDANSIGVEWNNGIGFKELIAGKDLPSFLRSSYKTPDGYRSRNAISKRALEPLASITNEKNMRKIEMLEAIKLGLNSIFDRKRGASTQYRPIFREFLQTIGIARGKAMVITCNSKKDMGKDIYALVNAKQNEITNRPLSRCTTKQLGLYLVFLLDKENLNSHKKA